MPSVADLVAALAERTRPESAAPWDPVGLQLGDSAGRADTVAVCHEVTEEVIAAVEAAPVDLVITYHPLLFDPVNRIVGGRSPAARALRLMRAGASLIVIHTDFDGAPGGTADALASALRLHDVAPFGGDEAEGVPAIGRVGSFELTLADLETRVAGAFGSTGLRVSGERSSTIDRVAVVPGSGSGHIAQAALLAEAIVTGDVSHHGVVRALDLGLAVLDPGHIATERPGISALVTMVADVVGDSVIDLTELDPQTWS